jgi:hypothetical protein
MRVAGCVMLVASAAHAAPCAPGGGVVLEIAQRAAPNARLATATTSLYGNGAWLTTVIDIDGKRVRSDAGCLDATKLGDVRDELDHAPWRLTKRDLTCHSDSRRFTVYTWKGRTVYTERPCSSSVLDRDSQHALDLVAAWVHVPDDLDGGNLRNERCLVNPLSPGCD